MTTEHDNNIEQLREHQWWIDDNTPYHPGWEGHLKERDRLLGLVPERYSNASLTNTLSGGELRMREYLKVLKVLQDNMEQFIGHDAIYTMVDIRDTVYARLERCCGPIRAKVEFEKIVKEARD